MPCLVSNPGHRSLVTRL